MWLERVRKLTLHMWLEELCTLTQQRVPRKGVETYSAYVARRVWKLTLHIWLEELCTLSLQRVPRKGVETYTAYVARRAVYT